MSSNAAAVNTRIALVAMNAILCYAYIVWYGLRGSQIAKAANA